MHISIRRVLCGCVGAGLAAAAWAQIANPTVRRDRDNFKLTALEALAQKSSRAAASTHSASAFIEAAQLYDYATEAAEGRQDKTAIARDAQAGAKAAEAAINLNPKSATAHALAGYLMGQLIPYVPGGGMRYGERSASELAQALQLDPNNVEALTDQGISSLYTPAAFGGSTAAAIQDFQKAAKLKPNDDTAHLWLAQAYEKSKAWAAAEREIKSALRLDPERKFSQYVAQRIAKKS
ncbi:MAG: tetratricopeptide repeat protein [Terriglobales bacterium]